MASGSQTKITLYPDMADKPYPHEFTLCKDLTMDEIKYLDSQLNLYQKLAYELMKKVQVGWAKPKGWKSPSEVWMARKGKATRLLTPQGFEFSLGWD